MQFLSVRFMADNIIIFVTKKIINQMTNNEIKLGSNSTLSASNQHQYFQPHAVTAYLRSVQ